MVRILRDVDTNAILGITARRSKQIRKWVFEHMEEVGFSWLMAIDSLGFTALEDRMILRIIQEFGGEFQSQTAPGNRVAVKVLLDMAMQAWRDNPRYDLGLADFQITSPPPLMRTRCPFVVYEFELDIASTPVTSFTGTGGNRQRLNASIEQALEPSFTLDTNLTTSQMPNRHCFQFRPSQLNHKLPLFTSQTLCQCTMAQKLPSF